MKFSYLSATAIICSVIWAAAVSCKGSSNPEKEDKKTETAIGDPIRVISGKVRFFIDVSDDAPRVLAGIDKSKLLDNITKLYVNGKSYEISTDDNGNKYSDVLENSLGTYNAAVTMKDGDKWFDSNPGDALTIPCGQFYGIDGEDAALNLFPMFGQYSETTGNRLVLTDITGLLRLKINGSGSIVSVKLQKEGENLAGVFLRSENELLPSEKTADFIVLNCTEGGNNVKMGNSFDLFAAPGDYGTANLVICSADRKVMRATVDLKLEAGKTVTKEINFSPDKDILWYEGFDLCVWGGDIMGGSDACGFSPTSETVTASYGKTLTGREYALNPVSYNNAGTGYIQPDVWDNIKYRSVGAVHQMSDSYVISRNLSDYELLFRAQEFPGMMAISYATPNARGILKTPQFRNISGIRNIKVSIRFRPLAGFGDDLLVQIMEGGMIKSARLDGKEIPAESLSYIGSGSLAVLKQSTIDIPGDMLSPNGWQTLELTVDNATEATRLHMGGNTVNQISHSFAVDEIEVTDLGGEMKRGSLRVLYWNIQNGMWADQANGYDNFVEWVKRYDPDVCIWCESASIYKDNTSVSASASDRYLPNGWAELAKRYGHDYSAQSGWRDNYPQEITSKYPITTLLKITDTEVKGKPVSHGAAIQQLDIKGRKINVVTLHMWPQAYAYGATDQTASSEANGGDYYREFEMKYILEHTVNAPEYASCTDWLMAGDFNSRNYSDEWRYQYGEASTKYLCQNAIRDGSNMVDIIGSWYPGRLVSSTFGEGRVDYVYASPSMYAKVKNAVSLIDTFTTIVPDFNYGTGYYIPSDHRPIMVDFEF